MANRALPWLVLPTLLIASSSKPAAEPAAPAAPATGVGVGSAPAAPPAAAAPAEIPPAGAPAAAAPVTTGSVVASQDTNWSGVVAEVLEFRRKGNTLTAKVRLRNGGPDPSRVEVKFDETYLMDAANAKKYEALRDEKGTYIASLRSGWNDRWYDDLKPAQSYTLWVKFPAPPPEVKAITLQLPGTPPFEDLPIQDG
jgi:hypothetical protein